MLGFYKLNFYRDQACTDFFKTLRVPVFDSALGIAYASERIRYGSGYAEGPGLYTVSSSSTQTSIQCKRPPYGSGVTYDDINTWINLATARIMTWLSPALGSRETVNDSFNAITVFDETGDFYLKNGSRIRAMLTTETILGQSNVPLLRLKFFNPSGTEVGDIPYSGGEGFIVRRPSGDLYRTKGSYLNYNHFAQCRQYVKSVHQNGYCGGYYVPFYLLDDDVVDNEQYDSILMNTICMLFRDDESQPYEYRTEISSYRKGGLYKFLGATSTKNKLTEIVEDAEYFEDTEDADNTYPGGGEDKNTYPEEGESGKGTFDNTNDEVDFPPMPLWDATSTGFISMWNPTITEITDLYGFLWDSDISTTLKKLFLEPMDAIISLAFFPVDPTNFPEKRNVTIGHVDTEIQMYAVQKQFVDFDFGTLKIDEYYGAAWDYSPYTQASIYLPYIGTQALDIDDVMNGTLHLKYRVDLLSGMCAAMLRVDRSRDGLQAVIYTWQGNCAMQVPITAGSARDFLNSIIQLGAMAGVSLAQPLAGAIDASMHKGEENYQSPIMGNNWINPTIATFSALNVIGQKVRVQRGGRVDANAGVMSPQEAYIILNRPVSAIPKGWNEYAGYPSLKVKTLSTQKGYTEIAYIKLNGLEATSDEIMELDGMLKGGVIL